LDVRDNGGGLVEAAEMLLQLLTPRRIEPGRMQFIANDAVRDLCRQQRPSNPRARSDLSAWLPSVEHALANGGRYSAALPMDDPAAMNAIGQRYHGPVVLLTSALCYSATDIFIAGFRDHGIGWIIGVDHNTGAGGANVWTEKQLRYALGAEGGELGSLPRGSGLRVALRRSLRVGAQAGTELEEIGVAPDEVVPATRRDALEGSVDLIALAARRLTEREWFRLDAEIVARPDGERVLVVSTRAIERLDATLDGRPLWSDRIAPHPSGKDGMKTPDYALPPRVHGTLELHGYRRGRLVAARKLSLARS
ncbi:MAG: S41 family peptidase, partial [Acetobacteraceae bacterium]